MNWPTCGTQAGRFGLPRWGSGARYGLSVSISIRSSGQSRAAAWTSGAPLNVTMPENDSVAPRSRQRLRLVGAAGEAVEDRALGGAFGAEDVERVVPGVAGVDDRVAGCRSWASWICAANAVCWASRGEWS